MQRKIMSITGTRSDYGLMTPVFREIGESKKLMLELIVTGMHLLPEFHTSLETIRRDNLGALHYASMLLGEDSGRAMAQSLGIAVFSFSPILEANRPDMLLLQGDRGEMLAGAIAAAHMNIPIVHMSGGDFSGSIDDPIRNAISKFAHLHLTTCAQSSARLLAMGETTNRIIEVGEPGLDLIRNMKFTPAEELAAEFDLDLAQPIILAAQHPVTTEAEQAAWQVRQTMEALADLNMQTVFTYPNSDAGGREMAQVLESYRWSKFIRIVPNLGSQRYLSLMRIASVLVGNSSSGIFEAPSFKLPVVNLGSRQHGRIRANNILDAGHEKTEILSTIKYALENREFRAALKGCLNPYGDGQAAPRTVAILESLRITPALFTKWIHTEESFLTESIDAV